MKKSLFLLMLLYSAYGLQAQEHLKNLRNKTAGQIANAPHGTFMDSSFFKNRIGVPTRDITAAVETRGLTPFDIAGNNLIAAKDTAVSRSRILVIPKNYAAAALTFKDRDSALVMVNYSTVNITANDTIPDGAAIYMEGQGRFNISAGVTLRIDGKFYGGIGRRFIGSGKVVFGANAVQEIYPNWWGAVGDSATLCAAAYNAAIASAPTGATIKTLPTRKGYLIESQISLPSHTDNRQILFDGGMSNFYYTGTEVMFFIAGDTTTTGQPQNGPRAPNGPRHVIQNFRAKRVDNVSSGAHGEAVRLQDCVQQTVMNFHIEGFKHGIRLYIDDKAQRWVEGCYIANGRIRRCRIGINFFAKSKGTKTNSTSFRNNTIYNVTITGQGPAALSLTDTTYGIKIDKEANVYDGQWTKLDIFSANRGVCIYVNGRLHGLTGQVAIENVGNNDTSAVYWYFDQYARTLWGDIKWGIVGRKLGKYFVFKPNIEGSPAYKMDEGTTTTQIRDTQLTGVLSSAYNGYSVYNITEGVMRTISSYNPVLKTLTLSSAIANQDSGDYYYLVKGSTFEGTLAADAGSNSTTIIDTQLSQNTDDYYNGWTVTVVDSATGATRGTRTVVDYVGSTKTLTLSSPLAGIGTNTVYHLNNGITYDALQGLKSQLPVSTPSGPDASKDKHRGESWLIKPNEFSRIMSVVRADADSLSDQRYVMDVQSDGRVTVRIRRGTPLEIVDIADERGRGGDLAPIRALNIGNTRSISDSTEIDSRNASHLKINSVSAAADSFKSLKGGFAGQVMTVIYTGDNVNVANLSGGTGTGRLFLANNRSIRAATGLRQMFIAESESGGIFWRELFRQWPMQTVTLTGDSTTPDVSRYFVVRLNNSNSTTITNFRNGKEDKILFVVHLNGNTTIAHNSNINLIGGSNFTGSANVIHAFVYDVNSAIWREISRSSGGMAVGGGWTDDGATVALSTTTDNVIVGGSTALGKLGIDGDTDEIQFVVQGHSTQTNNLVTVENSSGTDFFEITGVGNIEINNAATPTGSVGAITVGNGTPPSANPTNAFTLYSSGGEAKLRDAAGIISNVGHAHGALRMSNTSTVITLSASDTYRKITGTTAVSGSGMTVVADSITVTAAGTYKVDLHVAFQGTTVNDVFRVAVAVGGTPQTAFQGEQAVDVANNTESMSLSGYYVLSAGNVLSAVIKNVTAARDATIRQMTMVVTRID